MHSQKTGCGDRLTDAAFHNIHRGGCRRISGTFTVCGLWLTLLSHLLTVSPVAAQEALQADTTEPVWTTQQFRELARAVGEQRTVRVRGTVTVSLADRTFFIQDGEFGQYVFYKPPVPVEVGRQVIVTGHPSLGGYLPVLDGTAVEVAGPGTLPAPVPCTYADIMAGRHASQVVRLRARMAQERLRGGRQLLLTVDEAQDNFIADIETIAELDQLLKIASGSLVEITGVCSVRPNADRTQPAGFTIFPRSVADLVVVRGPGWWTRERTLTVLGGSLTALGLSSLWGWRLRRRVHQHATTLRERLERESLLEQRYRQLFLAHPQPMWVMDLSTLRFLAVNDAAVQHYGYSRSEFLSLTSRDIRVHDVAAETASGCGTSTERREGGQLEQHRRNDGSVIDVEVTSQTMEFDGRQALVVLAQDVTARRSAEAALRRSEQYRRAVIAAEPECVKILDARGKLIDMNPAGLAMLEATSLEEACRYSPEQFVLPEYLSRFMQLHQTVMAGGSGTLEFELQGLHGTRRWVETHAVPLRSADGTENLLLAITRDVTLRKQAEAEARRSQERFATIFRTSPDAIIIVRLADERIVEVNPACERLMGLTAAAAVGHTTAELGFWPDLQERAANIALLRASGALINREIQLCDRYGRRFTALWSSEIIDYAGERCILSLVRDISDRKAAEAALTRAREDLQKSERYFRALIEQSSDGIVVISADGRMTYRSPATATISGYAVGELLNQSYVTCIDEEDRGGAQTMFQELTASPGACQQMIHRLRRKDGSDVWVEATLQNLLHDPAVNGVVVNYHDVTARLAAERTLQDSRQRYADLVRTIDGIVWEADVRTFQFTFVSDRAERLLGYPVSAWLQQDFWIQHIHPDDRQWAIDVCLEGIRTGRSSDFEYRMVASDGSVLWLRDIVTLVHEQGEPRFLRGLMIDVTDRKEAELELQRALETLQLFIDSLPGCAAFVDDQQRYQLVNAGYEERFGRSRSEILGRSLQELHPADEYAEMRPWVDKALNGQEVHYERCLTAAAGKRTWLDVRYIPSPAVDGRVSGYFVLIFDVTPRKEAELALRESQERLDGILSSLDDVVWSCSADGSRMLFQNRAAETIYGRPQADFFAEPDLWLQVVHPEDRSRVAAAAERFLQQGSGFDEEYRIVRPDGEIRWLRNRACFVRDASGQPVRIDGTNTDITARRQAEEDRRSFERQIQQTQKLESLGVLAGGVAHDFNNLLTVVMGNLGLAMLDVAENSRVHAALTEAEKATQRAAELAGQMLAYSGKGRFVIRRVELSVIVQDMASMLQAAISRRATLRIQAAAQEPAVDVDVTQLRQIILNLVINASDAIGDQPGTITVTTGALECDEAYLATTWLKDPLPRGQYAFLEVTDTGCGVAAENLPKIFDPFFTTKFTGRGLGLAAVLGIVRSHKGAVKVDSTPGLGTTFRVLFPVAGAAATADTAAAGPEAAAREAGCILLVDDEDSIRSIGRQMLERLGFEVLVACDGADAVRQCQQHAQKITAVLLDLTMPNMNGEESLVELRRIRPDIPVFLSSGYSQQELIPKLAGPSVAGFIAKPYTLADLRTALRALPALSTPPAADADPSATAR